MNFFDSTLIYPIFDVESIGDGPRVPRAHQEVVFATSQQNKQPTPVMSTLSSWMGLEIVVVVEVQIQGCPCV